MWKFVAVFAVFSMANGLEHIDDSLINKNVQRTIDLNSQLVKIGGTITIENTGEGSVASYLLAIEDPDSFSSITVQDSQKNPLKIEQFRARFQGPERIAFKVHLRPSLEPGKTTTIIFESFFTNSLKFCPKCVTQKEKQLVKYEGNYYFYSPYVTKTQKTDVLVNSRVVEKYSKLKPVSQTDSTITYGPYTDIEQFARDSLSVHYENNGPFLSVSRLQRTIEVSHWGNIAIEENIDLKHTGALLKGSFSRYDYQRDTVANHHSIRSYVTVLPALAHSIYYRDMNGNISTSNVRTHKDYIEVELKPRFPLFGGWRSSYTLGYSVPSSRYLFRKPSGEFLLKVRLIDHVFDDMAVEDLETDIVLPVGVTDIKVKAPYEVKRLDDKVAYKTVIRLSKQNLVEQHIQDVEISYNWNTHMLLHEPILLFLALFSLFIAIFYEAKSVRQVDVPSFSGSFGILPKHVPTLAVLKPGVVSVYENEGNVKKIFVSSGTVTINEDSSVQILAEEAHPVENIDASAARELLTKSQSQLSSAANDQAKAEAEIAVEVSEALVKAAE
ncbi:hypothetical protein HUJ04_005562 [Dendroctonus ponderosae]|nr:hypothetical protein HUJ04_005551 [Dendroctonus ponderosae]KAH1001562.1 hypothetical protein HUJ04_005562 [Dendroctonus ponderosae]KAH1004546.1 hypothetical protein HUJ05_005344 [Dendroctonus ponderosae]